MILLQDIEANQAVFTLKTVYTHRDKRVTCNKTSKKTIVFPVKFLFGQVPAHKILSDYDRILKACTSVVSWKDAWSKLASSLAFILGR